MSGVRDLARIWLRARVKAGGVTTDRFECPGDAVRPPKTGGGKIKLEPLIVTPVPPPRSIWGIVLPVVLLVGIVGLIAVMYASGARQLAGGFGLFGGMAAFKALFWYGGYSPGGVPENVVGELTSS